MSFYEETERGRFRFASPPLGRLDKLEAGAYQIDLNPERGLTLQRVARVGDGLIESNHVELRAAVTKFWACAEVFRKLELTYKRGVLLHGKAGCGKTSLMNQFSEEITRQGGITLFWSGSSLIARVIEQIHAREPGRNIIVIIEDIDQKLRGDSGILEYLDGYKSQPHVLNVATTNYLSTLPDTIKKRPSRFDTVIEIKPPSLKVRKVYMEGLFKKLDLKVDERYIKETDGLSFAEMKELFIATVALDQGFGETLGRFKTVGVEAAATPHDPHVCEKEWDDCAPCQVHWDEDGLPLIDDCKECHDEREAEFAAA